MAAAHVAAVQVAVVTKASQETAWVAEVEQAVRTTGMHICDPHCCHSTIAPRRWLCARVDTYGDAYFSIHVDTHFDTHFDIYFDTHFDIYFDTYFDTYLTHNLTHILTHI